MDYLNWKTSEDVAIQDQTTPTIILPMVQLLWSTVLDSDTVVWAYTMVVTSASWFVIWQHIRIISDTLDKFYYWTILWIAWTTITVDTQICCIYSEWDDVTISNTNMAVNWSITPVIFKLRTWTPSTPSAVDITRMIFQCIAVSAIDLSLFGDLAALTRWLAFRRVNWDVTNIFNIKTNKELAGITYDFDEYAATNPAQWVDWFISKLTFAWQNRIWVVLRVESDWNLEMLVQDDLRWLTNLQVVLEWHAVQD